MAMPTRVLLVEDEPLISVLYEDILEPTEFALAATLLCNKDALEWLEVNKPDVAIVDYTLPDGPCLPVIDALKEAGIPFLVSTGHLSTSIPELEGIPTLLKPFQEAHLMLMLREIAPTAIS